MCISMHNLNKSICATYIDEKTVEITKYVSVNHILAFSPLKFCIKSKVRVSISKRVSFNVHVKLFY